MKVALGEINVLQNTICIFVMLNNFCQVNVKNKFYTKTTFHTLCHNNNSFASVQMLVFKNNRIIFFFFAGYLRIKSKSK